MVLAMDAGWKTVLWIGVALITTGLLFVISSSPESSQSGVGVCGTCQESNVLTTYVGVASMLLGTLLEGVALSRTVR